MSSRKHAPKRKATSFEDSYRELEAEVERAGPEAILDFERMKAAYGISADAAVRGLTVTEVLMRVFRRTGTTVETLRQLREEWERKTPRKKAPKKPTPQEPLNTRLQRMDGLDLADPEVMKTSWRSDTKHDPSLAEPKTAKKKRRSR